MKHVIICYRQYGRWSATMPFEDRKSAERHADLRLRTDEIKDKTTGRVLVKNSREHIKDITFIDVELPD